jgi:UDP-glucose 4-epimerase
MCGDLCEFALKHNINKIMKNSVAIYGFTQADIGESGEQNYINDYGRTKYLAE